MYKIISQCDFINEFERCGRGNQFSRTALRELYNFLEDCNEDEKGMEMDVICLCCDFAESTLDELRELYFDAEDKVNDDEVIEYMEKNTSVIWHDGENVLYQQF